ncbi:MAG TPA: hypothetical protein G4O11_12335 [Anaerolineae bacterium]|nr:hypothetical protein [Anaerolineae bacterium]
MKFVALYGASPDGLELSSAEVQTIACILASLSLIIAWKIPRTVRPA